jgi:uncharacterized membrane protein
MFIGIKLIIGLVLLAMVFISMFFLIGELRSGKSTFESMGGVAGTMMFVMFVTAVYFKMFVFSSEKKDDSEEREQEGV